MAVVQPGASSLDETPDLPWPAGDPFAAQGPKPRRSLPPAPHGGWSPGRSIERLIAILIMHPRHPGIHIAIDS